MPLSRRIKESSHLALELLGGILELSLELLEVRGFLRDEQQIVCLDFSTEDHGGGLLQIQSVSPFPDLKSFQIFIKVISNLGNRHDSFSHYHSLFSLSHSHSISK